MSLVRKGFYKKLESIKKKGLQGKESLWKNGPVRKGGLLE